MAPPTAASPVTGGVLPPSDQAQTYRPATTDRRHLLRAGLRGAALATAGAAVGASGGAAAAHHLDTHLKPTARVAPRPGQRALLGARVLFQGPPDQRLACVTFDDGPDPRWTPLVLDLLAEIEVRATFFVLGEAVQARPELVARQVEAGHEVGVHNWVHTDVYGVEVEQLRDSVDRTVAVIQEAGAPRPRLWRPPYGRVDAPALMVAAERGLDVLLWSLNSPSAAAAAAVADKAGPGSVILCHDGRTQPTEALLRAMARSLATLKARGLELVTGSQMLVASQAQAGAAGGLTAH